jgi:hypothetical protein
MREYSKRIKRLIREWMTEAYERELHRELTKLDESFADWRRGAVSSGELSHRIHEWETGPSRALFKHYNRGSQDMWRMPLWWGYWMKRKCQRSY